jgi:hypothetical protein
VMINMNEASNMHNEACNIHGRDGQAKPCSREG